MPPRLKRFPRAQIKRLILRAGAPRSTANAEIYLGALVGTMLEALVHAAGAGAAAARRKTVTTADVVHAFARLHSVPAAAKPLTRRCAPGATGQRQYECLILAPTVVQHDARVALRAALPGGRLGHEAALMLQTGLEALAHSLVHEALAVMKARKSATLTDADLTVVRKLLEKCFPIFAKSSNKWLNLTILG